MCVFVFNFFSIHSILFQARRLRKTLGGGMRQVGVLCAAGLIAVKENVVKLEADHKNAKFLAGLSVAFSPSFYLLTLILI